MELKITKHARFKMSELGVSKEQIKIAIKRGPKYKQTDGLLAVYTYFAVAYKKIGDNIYKIKTVKPK